MLFPQLTKKHSSSNPQANMKETFQACTLDTISSSPKCYTISDFYALILEAWIQYILIVLLTFQVTT